MLVDHLDAAYVCSVKKLYMHARPHTQKGKAEECC